MDYLTKGDLVYLNKKVVIEVGGINYGILSESGLDVILQQPKQVVFGRELYPTIWLKAAFILQKIAKKRVFRDGNKRTAIIASLTFLDFNGYKVKDIDLINNSEGFALAVTNSSDDEATMLKVAEWLEMVHEKS